MLMSLGFLQRFEIYSAKLLTLAEQIFEDDFSSSLNDSSC